LFAGEAILQVISGYQGIGKLPVADKRLEDVKSRLKCARSEKK
jgi:hypothetical protein